MSDRTPESHIEADVSATNFLDGVSERLTKLILERGYDNTPMSVIAKTLGMTKAGIYHHIETKEDLLYAVHRRAIGQMLLPVIERADLVPEPEAKLRLFLFEYAHLMTRDPAARVLINEAHRLSPERYGEIRGVWRRGYHLVRDSIAALQESGRCRTDIKPSHAAFAALGMCSWILYWFDYSRPSTGNEIAATMCNIFMSGVLSKEAPVKQTKSEQASG
jgi:AcrR family transcriptional regulator